MHKNFLIIMKEAGMASKNVPKSLLMNILFKSASAREKIS